MTERYDTDSGVVNDALKSLYKVRAQQYRPTRFRSLMPVSNGGMPEWVQTMSRNTTESFAEFKPAGFMHTLKTLGTEELTEDTFRTLTLHSAFMLLDDELRAYQATGIDISPRRVTALQTKAEQVLNDIAATGYNGARIKGLLNQANALSPTDAQVHLADNAFIDFTDGETAEACANALVVAVQQFHNNSLEVYEANQIILPTTQWDYLARVRSSIDNRTGLELFQEAYPEVRVAKWNKCNGLGTNNNGRIVVNSNSPDVLEMVMLYELKETSRIRTHEGVEVGMKMKTAGVIVNEPRGVEYYDLEAA